MTNMTSAISEESLSLRKFDDLLPQLRVLALLKQKAFLTHLGCFVPKEKSRFRLFQVFELASPLIQFCES